MYKVAIIGAGNIASGFDTPESKKILTHAHAITVHSDFELMGFFDVDEEKTTQAVKRWGGKMYSDLTMAVQNADVVCCCVPDKFHCDILKKLAQFHPMLVITEKPLVCNYKETEEIRNLYEEKIPVAVNYSRRFLREFHYLRDEIKLYGKFLKGVGFYGKGILHNGSHMIDLLQFLLGKVESVRTFETGVCDFDANDFSYDAILKIKQENFYMLSIDCSAATIFEIELFFEKAKVRILNGGEIIEIYEVKASDTYVGYKNYQLIEIRNVDYSGAIMGLMDNVSQFLKGKQTLNCTLQDGIDALKICTCIRGELV